MKRIKIDGKSYNLPTAHSELTLGDFLFYEGYQGTQLEKQVALVSKLSGVPKQIFYDAEKSLFVKVAAQMERLFKEPQQESDPVTKFIFEGEVYRYDEFSEITMAQYVDLDFRIQEHTTETEEGSQLVSVQCYPFLLGILFLKEGEKYNSKVSEERAELFKRLPLNKSLATVNFFLTRSERLKEIARRSKSMRDQLAMAIN